MENLTIIGSGTMGHSIALSAAWAEINVKMYGLNEMELEKGLLGIKNKLNVLLQNGLITFRDFEDIKARITGSHSMEDAAKGASFIIECIPEDLVVKQELFRYLDKICAAAWIKYVHR